MATDDRQQTTLRPLLIKKFCRFCIAWKPEKCAHGNGEKIVASQRYHTKHV